LEQHDVLADGIPAPRIDLVCDVIARNVESAKLIAMNDATLAYGQTA
jgi:hypothetical protein